ncbi:MAG: hypothetical protein N2V77_06535 [Canidatus Methanoxibalbensis ujae]|nr:hypothetical protein [Candidatus Methanoxibalbensis ujae]
MLRIESDIVAADSRLFIFSHLFIEHGWQVENYGYERLSYERAGAVEIEPPPLQD